jgi:hypothetical protein
MTVYRSSIPKMAHERVVERFENGAKKKAEYWLKRKQVGIRWFYENGEPELEYGMKDGLPHGRLYTWSESGSLTWMEPRRKGRIHGVSKQWNDSGELLGTYTLINGTGVDVWRHQLEDGRVYIAELHPMEDGQPHGIELWLDEEQIRSHELYWFKGEVHGIERRWNVKGGMSRGFPRFWMNGKQMTRGEYLKAQRGDKTLPKYSIRDNASKRRLPNVYRGLK